MDPEGGSAPDALNCPDDPGHEQQQHELQFVADSEDQLARITTEHEQLHTWVLQFIGANAGSSETAEQLTGTERSVEQLITTIYTASTAQAHLSYLKYWAEAVRELERLLQEAGPSLDSSTAAASPESVVEQVQGSMPPLQAVVQAYSTAVHAADYVASYMQPGPYTLPQLQAVASAVDSRMQDCRRALHDRLAKDAHHVLTLMGWPPPLATGSGLEPAADTASAAPPLGFTGFDMQPPLLHALLLVLQQLTQVQQLALRAAFARLQPGASASRDTEEPLLWAASVLAEPLQARLQAHFEPSNAAGRLDKPEWLFQVVLKLVQEHTPHMAALQQVAVACGLDSHYHMSVEWARAMRAAAKAVLHSVRLPALQDQGADEDEAGALWEAHIAAALQFEAQLSPYLGGAIAQAAGDVLPDVLLVGSVLGAVTEEQSHFDAWLACERRRALSQVHAMTQHDDAWQSAAAAEDPVADHGGPGGRAAPDLSLAGGGWRQEFYPPRWAEGVHRLVAGVVDKSKHLPTAAAQQEHLDAVVGAVLDEVRQLCATYTEQAVHLRSQHSLSHALRVGACVSAARYLHHHLGELLDSPTIHRLAALPEPPAPAGASPRPLPSAAAGSPARASPGKALTYFGTSPGATPLKGLLGDVVVKPSYAPQLASPPVLASALSSLAALHRDGCLRIARELALGFGRSATAYRTLLDSSPHYPVHEGAAGTALPVLLPALSFTQAALRSLSHALDAPSFQDIWRALTVPVNRFLFNTVATEAYFTPAGATQFAVDCSALLSVFAEFCKRPEAHFKEVMAAARLLTLPEDYTPGVVQLASAQQVAGEPLWKEPYLASLKVGCLSAQQVVAVIERRR